MKLTAVALLLVSCTASPQPDGSCLNEIWTSASTSDRMFDASHDALNEGFISCSARTTPSLLRDSLEKIQKALVSNDANFLADQIHFPLVFIDKNGKDSKLERAEFVQRYQEIFADGLRQKTLKASFSSINIAGYRGAFLDGGYLWWTSDKTTKSPKIGTLNAKAIP